MLYSIPKQHQERTKRTIREYKKRSRKRQETTTVRGSSSLDKAARNRFHFIRKSVILSTCTRTAGCTRIERSAIVCNHVRSEIAVNCRRCTLRNTDKDCKGKEEKQNKEGNTIKEGEWKGK